MVSRDMNHDLPELNWEELSLKGNQHIPHLNTALKNETLQIGTSVSKINQAAKKVIQVCIRVLSHSK